MSGSESNLLENGQGFKYAMQTLDGARIGIAANHGHGATRLDEATVFQDPMPLSSDCKVAGDSWMVAIWRPK